MKLRTALGPLLALSLVGASGVAGFAGAPASKGAARSGLIAAADPADSQALGIQVTTPSLPVLTRGPRRSTSLAAVSAGVLFAAPGGDGDSWTDTEGVGYQLGLVNAPELSECFGQAAKAKREQLVADGFVADAYKVDNRGRQVSVVTLADGTDLNVWLARHGYVDDRYLGRFRAEDPSLAAELDLAFAAAKRERLGLWSACGTSGPGSLAAG